MNPYTIYVNQIEELQITKDMGELDKIFHKAKSTIVQGEKIILARKNLSGVIETFDEMTTEAELIMYKNSVYKYL